MIPAILSTDHERAWISFAAINRLILLEAVEGKVGNNWETVDFLLDLSVSKGVVSASAQTRPILILGSVQMRRRL